MSWSPQQEGALKAVADWLKAAPGKTTLAREFAQGVEGPVVFGAFTGKAAYVMRRKGCADAAKDLTVVV